MEKTRSIKKVLLAMMLLFAIFATSFVFAGCNKTEDDEIFDQSHYSNFLFSVFDESNKAVEIAAASTDIEGNVVVPEKIKIDGIDYSVTAIGKNMNGFYGCNKMTSLILPKTIKEIGNNMYLGGAKLANIIVSDNNANYSSQTGILYDKNKTKLIRVPEGINLTEIEVQSSVKTIEEQAFAKCLNIARVVLKNVETIKRQAFYNCTGLDTIVLPASLTTIENEAFYGAGPISDFEIQSATIYTQILASAANSWVSGMFLPDNILISSSIDTGVKTGLLASYSEPTNNADNTYKVYSKL